MHNVSYFYVHTYDKKKHFRSFCLISLLGFYFYTTCEWLRSRVSFPSKESIGICQITFLFNPLNQRMKRKVRRVKKACLDLRQ